MGELQKYCNSDRESANAAQKVAESGHAARVRLPSRIPARLGITGPPGSGKTTLARRLPRLALCTDSALGCAGDPAANLLRMAPVSGPLLIEGTLVAALCLRGLQLDELWVLTRTPSGRTPRQIAVWRKCQAELARLRRSRRCPRIRELGPNG